MDEFVYKENRIIKKLNKVLCFTLIISFITSFSFASSNVAGDAVNNINGGEGVYGALGQIIGILSWLAFIIAVGKMIQIGIMFMLGAGKSKNDAKSALIPWLVGAAVCALFGSVGPAIISLIMGSGSGDIFGI